MNQKKCNIECHYWGADMDGAFCVHEKVVEKYPYGLSLTSNEIVKYCPAPEHPLYKLTTREDRLKLLKAME